MNCFNGFSNWGLGSAVKVNKGIKFIEGRLNNQILRLEFGLKLVGVCLSVFYLLSWGCIFEHEEKGKSRNWVCLADGHCAFAAAACHKRGAFKARKAQRGADESGLVESVARNARINGWL